MQTLNELADQIKLSDDQKKAITVYLNQIVVELLESIKQDNIQNFDETIKSINSEI